MKVAFHTLGCKLNQYETVALEEELLARGHEKVPYPQPAELYIINTCTVTGRADLQCRQAIRKAFRCNPAASIIVTGCYAQINPEILASLPGVKLVLGNTEKESLGRMLSQLEAINQPQVVVGDIGNKKDFAPLRISRFSDHTRAFVKIQDGCSHKCSYCIVPAARGPSRSAAPDAVIKQVETLAQAGYQEVVLTGVHIGTYGGDGGGGWTLARLLKELVSITALKRLRLSSIEPREITEELLELLITSPKICRHFHIPLQSGDDDVLLLMRRNYSTKDYARLIQRLFEGIKGVCMGADIIAGFPQETWERFQNTYAFIKDLPLSYLHVFPFSLRPGTPAAGMAEPVASQERTQRARLLRDLSKKKYQEFLHRHQGQELEVLVLNQAPQEKALEEGCLIGLSDNYIKVAVKANTNEVNQLMRIKVTRCLTKEVRGERLS